MPVSLFHPPPSPVSLECVAGARAFGAQQWPGSCLPPANAGCKYGRDALETAFDGLLSTIGSEGSPPR
jgi:hypothetical protein